jgi:hypothetical protein
VEELGFGVELRDGERLLGGESCPKIGTCRSGGMADAEDSKSSGLTPV